MSDSIAQEAALSGGFRTCKPSDHAFVVVAFGDSPFLAGCLASLRAQTVPSRIVIATSTPGEFIASAAAACGCEVVINPDRTDIAGDWNFALATTDAQLVTLAHQDDTYDPAFTDRTLKAFADGEGAVCFTGYQEIDDAGRPKRSKISVIKHLIDAVVLGPRAAVHGFRLRAYLSFGNPLPCSSVTFNTSQLAKFRFSPAFQSNLDWDAWWRLMIAKETFLRVPDRLVGRRHNPLTATARLIADGTRANEDRIMFRRAWPWPLSELIALAYRAGY